MYWADHPVIHFDPAVTGRKQHETSGHFFGAGPPKPSGAGEAGTRPDSAEIWQPRWQIWQRGWRRSRLNGPADWNLDLGRSRGPAAQRALGRGSSGEIAR